MGNNAISRKRHDEILQRLNEAGRVNVNDLSRDFEVSKITIRRDLDMLSEEGLLDRVHGGALARKRHPNELLFSEKGHTNIPEKDAIGRAAAAMLNDGDTLLLNGGSTTLQVIKHLNGKKIRVITNNAAAISIPRDPDVELIMVGGEHRGASHSLVGDLAVLTLSQVYGACAMLGTNGIDPQFGLTSSVYQETSVNRVMIERTRGPVIVLADHTKIGVVSNFETTAIENIDTLITDDHISPEMIDAFTAAGVRVIVARSER
jgi:DeoR family fructose operon transcriptional repressor